MRRRPKRRSARTSAAPTRPPTSREKLDEQERSDRDERRRVRRRHHEPLRRPGRRLRRERPARPDRRDRLRARQGGAHPRARRRAPTGRREVRRRRRTSTCTSSARGCCTRREDTLDFVPVVVRRARCSSSASQRCARIGLTGPVDPALLDDIDPARAGRDQLPFLREAGKVVNDRTTNWTRRAVPDARRGRELVHPDLDARRGAGEALGADRCTSAASTRTTRSRRGSERADALVGAGGALTERRFDALRFARPGHRPDRRPAADLDVDGRALRDGRRHRPHAEPPDRGGLHDARPRARRRRRARDEAARARRLDHPRARGRVRGRARRARSTPTRAPTSCARYAERDEGAARLGEVALVDGDGPHRPARTRSSTTRCSTRTPRATSRSARPTRSRVERGADHARVNESVDPRRLHDRLGRTWTVVGVHAADGERVPVLRDGRLADLASQQVARRRGGSGAAPRRSKRAAFSPARGPLAEVVGAGSSASGWRGTGSRSSRRARARRRARRST